MQPGADTVIFIVVYRCLLTVSCCVIPHSVRVRALRAFGVESFFTKQYPLPRLLCSLSRVSMCIETTAERCDHRGIVVL